MIRSRSGNMNGKGYRGNKNAVKGHDLDNKQVNWQIYEIIALPIKLGYYYLINRG